MAVLLLRCIVDAGLRHAGRPLAAWLRDVATQVGALAHSADERATVGVASSLGCITLWNTTLRAVELHIQATPEQCALICKRIWQDSVPVFLIKVLDRELSTLFAPA